ncbi:hypothetical protein PR003_g15550 [Phytophthora rubi]|uniref:Uncharacterized protein n=1 Tax=Phytophthora rubi TaxID=129364 RepID=A0A6A3L6Z9_9STRA|nr:hypothetical protein PR001_g15068 [Phytophthora rubi]KAE9329459.1 hypothetical protein PR003_g15550 [Phytophthora rubi]
MDIRLLLHEDSSSSIGVPSNPSSSASSSCSSADSSRDDPPAEASSTSTKQGAGRMCGNCGCLQCEWIRYGEALRDAALRLENTLTWQKHRNRSIRLSVCRLYLYMKDGNMRGVVPACIRVGLLQPWPESKRGHPSKPCIPCPVLAGVQGNEF